MANLPPPERDIRGQIHYRDQDGKMVSKERYEELLAAEKQSPSLGTSNPEPAVKFEGQNTTVNGDVVARDSNQAQGDQYIGTNYIYNDPLKQMEARLRSRWEGTKTRQEFDASLKEMRRQYERPPLDHLALRDIPLSDVDLHGVEASAADFAGCRATNANFCNANLNRANFSKANLDGANLERANLTGANLVGTSLRNASLRFATLTCAKLNGADFRYADLAGARLNLSVKDASTKMDEQWLVLWDMWNADISGGIKQQKIMKGYLRGSNLSQILIESSALISCDFTDADLTRATLKNVWVASTDLPTIFEKAKLTRARIENSNLAGVYLTGVDLSHAHLQKVDLREANLAWATLRQATLSEVDLRGADLSFADLKDTAITHPDCMDDKWRTVWELSNNRARKRDFAKYDLSRANLSGADLSQFNFAGTNLEGAILENTKLTGADFTNANLSNARFSGAFLRNAIFKDADLTGCDLRNTRSFTRAQWDQARFTDLAEPPDPLSD